MKLTLSLINHETVRIENAAPFPVKHGDRFAYAVELKSVPAVLIIELQPTEPKGYRPSILRCILLAMFFRRDVSRETLFVIQDRMARLRIF